MIGHYVNRLTTEQGARVLTEVIAPYPRAQMTQDERGWATIDLGTQTRCLVDVACQKPAGATEGTVLRSGIPAWQYSPEEVVGGRYDDLCLRFGATRVNNAIRNRILSNRARRVLQSVEAAHAR